MFALSDKVKFIERVFGKGDVTRNLTNIQVTCPICLQQSQKWSQKRKLAVRLSDDLVHCWVCGYSSRNLVPLLRKFGSHDDLSFYVEKSGSSLTFQKPAEDESIPLKLPEGFRLIAPLIGRGDRDVVRAMRYLKERGLTASDTWYYKFGVAPTLPDRVIMPSFDELGGLNFWTARSIIDAHPKYIDPPKECVRKNEIIFNEINLDWKKELVIVEGPFDLTKCPTNTTALRGNQLSEESRLLIQIVIHETPCVVMLDDDATDRAGKIVRTLTSYGVTAKRANLGEFHDPGEMTKKQVADCVKAARELQWEDHLSDKLSKLDRLHLSF